MSDSAAVREALVGALRLDLIDPGAGHALARERLPGWVRPSNWYLTGFLVPRGAPVGQRGDADVDDEAEVAENVGLGDDSMEDRRAAKRDLHRWLDGLPSQAPTVTSRACVGSWDLTNPGLASG